MRKEIKIDKTFCPSSNGYNLLKQYYTVLRWKRAKKVKVWYNYSHWNILHIESISFNL